MDRHTHRHAQGRGRGQGRASQISKKKRKTNHHHHSPPPRLLLLLVVGARCRLYSPGPDQEVRLWSQPILTCPDLPCPELPHTALSLTTHVLLVIHLHSTLDHATTSVAPAPTPNPPLFLSLSLSPHYPTLESALLPLPPSALLFTASSTPPINKSSSCYLC